jgi:hypothetical protein
MFSEMAPRNDVADFQNLLNFDFLTPS